MTFSARWLEINSHLGWTIILQSVLWPTWQNTHTSKCVCVQNMSALLLPLSTNLLLKPHQGFDDVTDATKICGCVFFCLSPVISNVASLQTTHPCGALSVSQIHHNAFDKKQLCYLKSECILELHVSFRSHWLVQRWKEEREITTVWEPYYPLNLSTVTMETLTLSHTAYLIGVILISALLYTSAFLNLYCV